MTRVELFMTVLFFALSSFDQNWESVKNSRRYLYGEGWKDERTEIGHGTNIMEVEYGSYLVICRLA